jgi:hypothetical protein
MRGPKGEPVRLHGPCDEMEEASESGCKVKEEGDVS